MSKSLALKIFAVPPSSSPIERVFSHANFATRLHRNRTEFQLLNDQLFTYINGHLNSDLFS